MARKRARKTFCPRCDTPLDLSLREDEAPACPHCGAALLPVHVAGALRRSVGGAIDFAVLLLTAGTLNLGLLALVDADPLLTNTRGLALVFAVLDLEVADVLRTIAPFLVMTVFYFTLFWTITGRTLGGRALGLRVVGPTGAPPRLPWALLRIFVHLFGLAVGLLGWIWTALDPEKRGWHDHVGRTFVVRDA